MDITLIETNKGRKSIVCNGYRYRVDIKLKSGEIAWRCASKGCKARIHTDSSASMVLQQKNLHNHETDVRKIERHVLRVCAKRTAIDDMSSSPSKIIRTELQSLSEENLVPKDIKSVARAVYRRRRKTRSSLQKTSGETRLNVVNKGKKTLANEKDLNLKVYVQKRHQAVRNLSVLTPSKDVIPEETAGDVKGLHNKAMEVEALAKHPEIVCSPGIPQHKVQQPTRPLKKTGKILLSMDSGVYQNFDTIIIKMTTL